MTHQYKQERASSKWPECEYQEPSRCSEGITMSSRQVKSSFLLIIFPNVRLMEK